VTELDAKRRDQFGRDALRIPTITKSHGDILPAAFFARPAAIVACDLIGRVVLTTIDGSPCAGRIVETEAYTGPEDDASHAAARIGRTKRNEAMFGAAGTAYIYRIYGVHWCLNAVTGDVGHPSAVLVRAAEPILGIEVVRQRRNQRPDRDLMRGPGNLCSALGVTGALDQCSLQEQPLVFLTGVQASSSAIRHGPRIGVTRASDLPLRFWIGGSEWVSGRS